MVTFPTLPCAPAEGALPRPDAGTTPEHRPATPDAEGLSPPPIPQAPVWWRERRAAVLREEWARRARAAQVELAAETLGTAAGPSD
jgi:hypothetical protein